ncbi:hypothetical protein FOA52_010021 [Chlamydomonas sp. UWO 241]|nr:hypothetical protein FOA52_010021 [Chlamydomonas sp. UWO 241]
MPPLKARKAKNGDEQPEGGVVKKAKEPKEAKAPKEPKDGKKAAKKVAKATTEAAEAEGAEAKAAEKAAKAAKKEAKAAKRALEESAGDEQGAKKKAKKAGAAAAVDDAVAGGSEEEAVAALPEVDTSLNLDNFDLSAGVKSILDAASGLHQVGRGAGRPPSCIVMLPTRELAKQDLMTRGRLKLDTIRYRVLDEVDRMMQMGFIEDVETILQAEEGHQAKIQTFLFSATMPKAIKDICNRFLKKDHKMVDLIGDDKMTQGAAVTVRHMMLPCHFSTRPTLVRDLIQSWGLGGRTIVFTDTKSDANDIAGSLSDSGIGARCLHGDMPQKAREEALDGFKTSKFNTLVATDVAARGLDIASVELVLMMDAPTDWETYIHRSGRTGRAGAKGTSIMLVTRRVEYMPAIIEAKGRFKFERIGAPQPHDMAVIAATRAVEMLADVDVSVVPFFRDAAAGYLEAASSPVEALAIALAKIAGIKKMAARRRG